MEVNGNKYNHIFFDLDHTLWDYDSNAEETLGELYQRFDLADLGIESAEKLVADFFEVNEGLWDQYNKGEINKFFLRNERFRMVFEAAGAVMNLISDDLIRQFNDKYLDECPQKSKLMPGAIDILDYLKDDYQLHLITNGFEEVQTTKIEKSGISGYFEKMITSEKAGHKKPYRGIFTYALKHTGAGLEESILIGDNLGTDIKGAIDFGMDQVFFNPHESGHNTKVQHEIKHLSELKTIL